MANYWAIEIGITQYRFLPPLSYAQRDAELLHQTLLQSGFSPGCCSLMADQITQSETDSGFPSKANICSAIARFQSAVQSEDLLICFFSGYGVQHQDQDYLLPIEADPAHIAETGLAVADLLQQLKAFPSRNILLLLDANRNQLGLNPAGLTSANYGFGSQTMQLAQALEIAVLLSCQPDQFSHQPLALRQGIFTAALANALSDCMTLEQLVSRLSLQLPQLSEEFWRPRQDLQAVVPASLRYQMLLPEARAIRPSSRESSRESGRSLGSSLRLLAGGQSAPDRPSEPQGFGLGQRLSALMAQAFPGGADGSSNFSISGSTGDATALAFPDGLEAVGLSDQFFWRRLLAQGGLIAGILLFGVILRNSGSLINSTDALSAQPDAGQSSAPAALQPTANPIQTGQPADQPALAPVAAIDPALLMQSAQSAVAAQQYDEANRQLVQIPAAQRSVEQQQLLEQVNRELLNQAKTLLIRTRSPMTENQVSDLVEAIKVARLIKPDQPLSAEAQQNIDRWSRLILDMAQGRAARANESSVMDAADNYTKAVAAARLVPDDQAVHDQAQQAVSLWSQKIFDLATTRASNGELDLAIQIGELVPSKTPAHAAAQEAIANWRNQPSPVN
ncbi:MAG: caspase family protein [Pegethrix bostrychoides GSE-TBD4-15B]|jgi:hypothetical protein|uniref:Caspase family protein n=1 Tax=Pegethrix bostrychoides GSE-TBD4-15B TaxID=2839662 RepID=A0A951P6A2_9CYAN|nr:caspase family protein [Pegethrix bostrychoides GSE-TBD4-15B]